MKGLSSDCKLPPEIVLALQMGGEYPCDRCNENREICRGEPKGSSYRQIEFISVMICPETFISVRGAKEFRVDITINEKKYGLHNIYCDDMLKSMFDQIWEDMGGKLKAIINQERTEQ